MKQAKQTPSVRQSLLTVEEVAFITGTTTQVVRRITRLELLTPARREPEPRFPPAALSRVRRLLRMHRELEVSWTSMELVLDLLERIEELRTEVDSLRRSLHGGGGTG